jgi:predicted membrane protein
MPLFASYQDRHSQRSIFLIFALVAAGSMFHYGFLVLIPAFLLGFLNMGVFNLKGVLAMLFGLITPFWIVMGLGIATPADFVMPRINGVWSLTAQSMSSPVLVLAALTAVLGITLAVMNFYTIMNYRMQTRVYNIFLMIMLVIAILAASLDYHDLAVFLPLLNLMVAIQIAQAFTLRTTFHHRYVLILLFTVACLATAAAHLLLP